MATRYVNGEISDPGVPTTRQEQNTAPAPAPSHPRGAIRVLYDTETGQTRVMESHATGGVVTPEVEQATARNAAGMPISLSSAKPTDVVTLPNGAGNSTAEVLEGIGLLRRTATGYEVIAPATTPAAAQTKPEEKSPVAEEPAGDVRGVEPTSETTDRTMKALADQSPMGVEAIVSSLSTTGEISDSLLSDLASQHEGDPEEFKAGVVAAVQDHVRAAHQAIRNVDATIDPVAFQAWLLKDPDLANRVTRDVMGKSVHAVQAAARTYAKNRDAAIESALNAQNVATRRGEDGTLYIDRTALGLPAIPRRGDFPANKWISAADAIRGKHLTFNEK